MKLNRIELRKILYDFNSISSRLLQANFEDYTDTVTKFVNYIKKTPMIYEYIVDCGPCEWNVQQEFQRVNETDEPFVLGNEPEEEIRNIFAILNYISEHKISVHFGVAMAYANSTKFQNIVNGFNERVVMILIRHIETYLTKIGIDMGLDERTTYTITIQNGQVNIANDNSTINATNLAGIDREQLSELLLAVRSTAIELSEEDKETLESSLEVIETESVSEKPRKGFLKTAIAGLNAIKGSAEFAAAVATLIQFIHTLNFI